MADWPRLLRWGWHSKEKLRGRLLLPTLRSRRLLKSRSDSTTLKIRLLELFNLGEFVRRLSVWVSQILYRSESMD